jgi:predicted 3-demethylubiquinone-9 3-methyltransferase (glyoxalase superfamily)
MPPRWAKPKEDAMANLFPCLWFDGNAEEAAGFYVTLLPGSHVDKVWRSPAETPSGPAGMVLTVDFTLAGQRFQGLNGGPDLRFNEAVSFVIDCDD